MLRVYSVFFLGGHFLPSFKLQSERRKYYRLNTCVPPPISLLKPNPQCDGVWGWGLQEVMSMGPP